MNNLNEEIELVLEQSLEEAPAQIGSLSARQLVKGPRFRDEPTRAPAAPVTPEEAPDEEAPDEEDRETPESDASVTRVIDTPRTHTTPAPAALPGEDEERRRAAAALSRRRTRSGDAGLPALEAKTLNEDKLVEIAIDFNELRKQELNESFLAMFGGWVEHILGAMFGGRSIPVSVSGNRREVESFARTIGGEKSYIETVKRYGLDHPTTYKNKAKLDASIKGFEKDTGLTWPFK